MHFFKNIIYIVLVLIFATVVSLLINSSSLQLLNNNAKVISLENFNTIKSDLKHGDIVEITGTIDLLHLISDSQSEASYFSGLKEFPNTVIVKFKQNKLNFNIQTFRGQLMLLNNDSLGKNIIEELNSSIDFNDPKNAELSQIFNEMTKQEIINSSKGEFSEDSILVLDEVLIDKNTIYTNIALIFIVVSIFLITLFRKRIFRVKRKITVGQVVLETPTL